MTNKRDIYSDDEHSILYAETNGACPLCVQPILFKKPDSKKPKKGYEVAHIYPLNPTNAQEKELVSIPKPINLNDMGNVVVLCPSCHTKYDKDFKRGEYIRLRQIKDKALDFSKAKLTASHYILASEVCEILDAIVNFDTDYSHLNPASFDVSTVDKKLKTGMSPIQKLEIKKNAINFYMRIKEHLQLLEQRDQVSVLILQQQVKVFYLEMIKQNPDNKDLVFNHVAQWISDRAQKSILAARVLTSFFVQNCEVFDVDPN